MEGRLWDIEKVLDDVVAELPVTEAEAPRDEGQVNVQVSQLARTYL